MCAYLIEYLCIINDVFFPGVHLVNMYSNTEVMAMKLKTSREKKASSGTTKQKEKVLIDFRQ